MSGAKSNNGIGVRSGTTPGAIFSIVSIGLNGIRGVSESRKESFCKSSDSPMLSPECRSWKIESDGCISRS